MYLSKNDFTGTGKVYRFTLKQYSKSKSNIIVTAILLIAVLVSVPVMSLVMDDTTTTTTTTIVDTALYDTGISAVWIRNNTSYEIAKDNVESDDVWSSIEFHNADFDTDTYKEHITADEVFVEISFDISKNSYLVKSYVADNTILEDSDLYYLASYISKLFDQSRLQSLGISEKQMAIIMSEYYAASMTMDELKDFDNSANSESKFAIQYAYSILVLILCMFSSSYIIRAIIEEKDSKLVEVLMVSVKPLALIAGKILAVMTYIFLLLVTLLGGFALSWFTSSKFLDVSSIGHLLQQSGITSGALNISPMTIVIILVSLALAYLTVSIISGLSGSCCASMEDMDSAYMSVVLIVLFGYIVSSFTAFIGSPGVSVFLSLFPIISIFTAPIKYVFGDIGLGILMLSWVIQILVIIYLSWFCSKVYADLIIHMGNRIKFKKLISMSRKGKEKEAY